MLLEYSIYDTVRDYECDSQGIVNNAEFMHYFEHARNSCIARLGYNLTQLHEKQEDPVVARAEIDFIRPMHGGDKYKVSTRIEQKGAMRLLFYQTISRIGNIAEEYNKDNNSISAVGDIDSKGAASSIGNNEIETEEIVCVKACFTIAVVKNGRPIPIIKSVFARLYN